MENKVIISIIIPCYNQADFLNETLSSVSKQTFKEWECLIIDDGSNDDSSKIARDWVQNDPRFVYYSKENKGVSHTRNVGLSLSKGKFIQFLDSDDILENSKLELSYKTFIDEPSTKMVFTNFSMFKIKTSENIKPYCKLENDCFNFESLLYNWNEVFSIPIHCGLIEKDLFNGVKFNENLTAQEDWLVWLQLFKNNSKTIFIDLPLVYYRLNPNSRTNTRDIIQDQIKVINLIKDVASLIEYDMFIKILFKRYLKEISINKLKIKNIKKSNTFQTGLAIKKIFIVFNILPFARRIFKLVLKFKNSLKTINT